MNREPDLWGLGIAVILPLHQVFVPEFTQVTGRNQFRRISRLPTASEIAAGRRPQPDQFLARPRIDSRQDAFDELSGDPVTGADVDSHRYSAANKFFACYDIGYHFLRAGGDDQRELVPVHGQTPLRIELHDIATGLKRAGGESAAAVSCALK